MLDRWTLEWIKPGLVKTAGLAVRTGITANQVSVGGFLCGLLVIPALWANMYLAALGVILINRFLDGLDGTIARQQGPTDAGGFLDITLDFVFYAAVPLGFALADPGRNSLAAAFLIFAFVGTGSSFLAFAALAAKHGIRSVRYPHKSLYYLGGITEGTETIAVFILFCLLPERFPVIAGFFAALCLLTALLRVIAGYRALQETET